MNLDTNTKTVDQSIDLDFKMSGDSTASMGPLVSGNNNSGLMNLYEIKGYGLVNLDSNTKKVDQSIDLDFKMSGDSTASMGPLVSGNNNRGLQNLIIMI